MSSALQNGCTCRRIAFVRGNSSLYLGNGLAPWRKPGVAWKKPCRRERKKLCVNCFSGELPARPASSRAGIRSQYCDWRTYHLLAQFDYEKGERGLCVHNFRGGCSCGIAFVKRKNRGRLLEKKEKKRARVRARCRFSQGIFLPGTARCPTTAAKLLPRCNHPPCSPLLK